MFWSIFIDMTSFLARTNYVQLDLNRDFGLPTLRSGPLKLPNIPARNLLHVDMRYPS